jgi:hypothetical protein
MELTQMTAGTAPGTLAARASAAPRPAFPVPVAVASTAERVLTTEPLWVAGPLVPGTPYRLTAITEGGPATEDLAALVIMDMEDPTASGEGLRVSPKGLIPPHLYLRTGPDLFRTDRHFTVNSPVHRLGLRLWGQRGPVTVRTFAVEPVVARPVNVFFSFDVEASPYRATDDSPIDRLVWCRQNGAEYGIGRICDVLEQHGIIGNFMIDFGSCAKEGAGPLARIIDHLAGRGHEVHLHLHPEDLPDPSRTAVERDRLRAIDRMDLERISYDTACRLLEYAIAVYERFTGQRARVYRAGSYKMNADVIRAAGDLGLTALTNVRQSDLVDRVIRGGDPALDLSPFTWPNGVVELPVDVTSPEAKSARNYAHAFANAVATKRFEPTVNLVMHSWSLTRRSDRGVNEVYAPEFEARLHELCEHALAHGRARGYREYLDETSTQRRVARYSSLRART